MEIIEIEDDGGDEAQTAQDKHVHEKSPASIDQGTHTEPKSLMSPDTRVYKYDMGYGDFCFGRKIDLWFPSSRFQDLLRPHKGNNVLFEEIGGFKRTEPFPFYKLPIEIRYRILGLLTDPFRALYSEEVELNLFSHQPYTGCDEYFKGDYNNFRALKKLNPVYLAFDTTTDHEFPTEETSEESADESSEASSGDSSEESLQKPAEETPEEYEQRVSDFEYEKSKFWHMRKYHPGRRERYFPETYPTYRESFTGEKDWSMIELMRNMSNVSCQFRTELAKVFYTKVHLCVPISWDISTIRSFLEDRPSAIAGIKSLMIDIDTDIENHPENDDRYKKEPYFADVMEVCKYIGTVLNLDSFELILHITPANLSQLAEGRGDLLWLEQAIRPIRVATDFTCSLMVLTYEEIEEDEHEKAEMLMKELQHKYQDQINDFLWPDTLRKTRKKEEELKRYAE